MTQVDRRQQKDIPSVLFDAGSNHFTVIEHINFLGAFKGPNAGKMEYAPIKLQPREMTIIAEEKSLLGQRDITAQSEIDPAVSFKLYSKQANHMGDLSVLFERSGNTITAKKPDNAVLHMNGDSEPHVFLVFAKNKPPEAQVRKPLLGVPTGLSQPQVQKSMFPKRAPMETVVRVPLSHAKAVFDIR